MSNQSIKVSIAGRTYPLNVPKDQEESILVAVKRVQEQIDKLRSTYAIKDAQDLLAMTALELASREQEQSEKGKEETRDEVAQEILDFMDSLNT